MIDAGVGMSTNVDSRLAGKEAARDALAGLSGSPKLAILAVDSLTRKKFNYSDVLKGIREEIGDEIPLIGSTVNGILVNDRYALKSVGLMLLGGDINIDAIFEYGKSRLEYQKIAEDIIRIKNGLEPNPNQLLFMFQDGMKFPPEVFERQKSLNSRMVSLLSGLVAKSFKNQLDEFAEKGQGMPSVQELIELLYDKGWDLPILGNVASNVRDYDNMEFFDSKVLEDALVGVILSGSDSTKFGYGYSAGALPTGVMTHVTKNIGNFLLKLDNKPALKGFCEAIGIEKESLRELRYQAFLNFYQILGIQEKVGDKNYIHLTATITNPDLENLLTTGFPFSKTPENIEIFQSTTPVLLQTAKEAVEQAIQNISEPRFLLGMDCALRMFAYGDNYPKIIEIIKDAIGADVPKLIMGSGGEIFGTQKKGFYFNNMTFLTFVGGS